MYDIKVHSQKIVLLILIFWEHLTLPRKKLSEVKEIVKLSNLKVIYGVRVGLLFKYLGIKKSTIRKQRKKIIATLN